MIDTIGVNERNISGIGNQRIMVTEIEFRLCQKRSGLPLFSAYSSSTRTFLTIPNQGYISNP